MTTARTSTDSNAILLTALDVAGRLRISRSTWFALVRDGHAPRPIYMTPRCPRWIRTDIEAWIEAGKPHREDWERSRSRSKR